ncbi:MAG: dipeptide epimerase [Muribaculaceae bacterium]|nr:dipeptide epimerase [Muribaculaceae bacterium]
MDRRKFLAGAGIGVLAAASPISLSAIENLVQPKPRKSGRLNLSFFPYELKLRHAWNLARNSRTTTPDVQVQLEYDGIVGYGEASMPPYLGETTESVMNFLSSLDLTQFNDPFKMEDILAYVDNVAPNNRAAKASVDIALHDLVGKIMGQPWYKIWGYSAEKTPNTSFTIGIDTADVVRKKVEEARPYKVIKVKMGLDNDKQTVDIIKEMMPDVPICCDANQGWSSKEYALEMCHWLKERNCLFVEQPFDKTWVDETAWLTERSPLPIIADEAFQRLPDIVKFKGVYSGINIKLMKSTGLYEAHKMVTLAKSLGMKVMVGCMTETSCAVTAAANLSPVVDFCDLDGNLLIANDRFSGMTVENGKVTLHDIPGIGVKLL